MSFTARQRAWFHRVYNHQCAFYDLYEGGWRRCPAREPLEIHHILPTRFAKIWFPDFERDRALNGIALCKWKHHQLVHPDLAYAYQQYRIGNKQAFKEMVHERDLMVAKGEIYWNPRWDFVFHRIAKRYVFRYIQKHPNDLFPRRGVRSERYGNP